MRRRDRQNGFALTDALIAAAIAAGVAVTAAQSISVAIKSTKTANELGAVLVEAEIIAARLDAGMRGDAILHGYDNWTFEMSPIPVEGLAAENYGFALQRLTFTHHRAPAFSFERVVTMGRDQ